MNEEIERLRREQREALEHLAPGHSCGHCSRSGVIRWLEDAFAEEIYILFRDCDDFSDYSTQCKLVIQCDTPDNIGISGKRGKNGDE